MEPKTIKKIWDLLETVTPLRSDCGALCKGACCEPSAAGDGMILLPGERELMGEYPDRFFSKAFFAGFGEVEFFACDGSCNRATRPFACRVFPLAPRFAKGAWGSRMDARGRPVCPLCQGPKGALQKQFILACEEAFQILAQDPEGERFLRAWQDAEKLYREPLW